jgi:hypothetical protein
MRRMTCYLATAVAAQMPGTTFTPVAPSRFRAPDDNKALEAFGRLSETAESPFTDEKQMDALPDNGTDQMNFMATANVMDAEGTGSLLFTVSSFQPAHRAFQIQQCNSPHSLSECQVRTGPQGQTILASATESPGGHLSFHVSVFSGRSHIMGFAQNTAQDGPRGGGPTRPAAPLDVDQLIGITSAPELVLFK